MKQIPYYGKGKGSWILNVTPLKQESWIDLEVEKLVFSSRKIGLLLNFVYLLCVSISEF